MPVSYFNRRVLGAYRLIMAVLGQMHCEESRRSERRKAVQSTLSISSSDLVLSYF